MKPKPISIQKRSRLVLSLIEPCDPRQSLKKWADTVGIPRSIRTTDLILLSLLFASVELAADPPVIPQDVRASIQRRVDYQYCPSMVVGMVNADGQVFYAYGTKSIGKQELPDEHTLYEIGSISKTFTTSLLAEMVQKREVALNDTVQSLVSPMVPIPAYRGSEITLEHLATHHSGLPTNPDDLLENDPTNPFYPYPDTALHAFLDRYQLQRRPGQTFEYSNIGIGLLGHALSLKAGLDFESLLRERICDPLGMKDTVITQSAEQESRRATGYSGVIERPYFKADALAPAGSLLSTAHDLVIYLEHQMQLKSSTLNEALSLTHPKRKRSDSPGLDIGLGWLRISNTPNPILVHDGVTLGHNAFVGFDPIQQLGVVVLCNARLNAHTQAQNIGLHLLFPPSALASVRRSAQVSLDELRALYGTYGNEEKESFTFGIENGHLTMEFSLEPGLRHTLYPLHSRRFKLYEAITEATCTFNLDDSGHPIQMSWTQSGTTTRYDRLARPAQLSLQTEGKQPALQITDGDGMTQYDVQVSSDFQEWTSLGTSSLWDDPMPIAMDASKAFFRAVTHSE
ncbi:serine hydrolase [Verrucomicrobia bacterium]|nr:serine hydrolase [Verrucomicrobiota bacterium]MDG1891765.1 serine hydrolase [Verrucomicrobiota bacterium]